MAGPDYETVASADHANQSSEAELSGADSGSDSEEYSDRRAQKHRRSEDRRRYDRETLGREEEVETLLAAGEKGGSLRKSGLRRLEQGGLESTSESSSLVDSSEEDLRRLREVRGRKVSLCRPWE